MRGSADGMRSWLAGFRSRPVVLSSPHPASECLGRLVTVTTWRTATSWYLDPATVGRSVPRLRGQVSPSRISVARFDDAAGRDSFTPWLNGRLEQAPGGGATLTGTIGLQPAVAVLLPVITGVGGLLATGAVATGATLLGRGHLSGMRAVLIALAVTAFTAGLAVVGLRSLERKIPKLVEEMNAILGSTAIFTDPPAVPGAGAQGRDAPSAYP